MKAILLIIFIAFSQICAYGQVKTAKNYLKEGIDSLNANNATSAIKLLSKAKKLSKKDLMLEVKVLAILAEAYSLNNDTILAPKTYQKTLELYNRNPRLKKSSKDYSAFLTKYGEWCIDKELYDKAKLLHLEAKEIRLKSVGRLHQDYAQSLNNLAILYLYQGLYQKAEPLFLKAKEINFKALGNFHPDYSGILNNLGTLYLYQGLYSKAEPLFLEAKEISFKSLGGLHQDYAQNLNNLAALYLFQGLYSKAEPLFLEAKEIRLKSLGRLHLDYAQSLNNLASLYEHKGQYGIAESLYIEAKEIRFKLLGSNHSLHANSLNNLAILYQYQGLYAKAEPLFLEAKEITFKVRGSDHPDYANSLNNLANLYEFQWLFAKAEPLYLEAKEIALKYLGSSHPDYAACLKNLARIYTFQHQYTKAEPLFLEAKKIEFNTLGISHPDYSFTIEELAKLYQSQGLYGKAEPLLLEAKEINFKALGSNHPDYASSLTYIARLYQSQGLYEKAEPLYLEAKDIINNSLGSSHPTFGWSLNNIYSLYQETNNPKALLYDSLQFESAKGTIFNNKDLNSQTFESIINEKRVYLNLSEYYKSHQISKVLSSTSLAYSQALLIKGLGLEAGITLRNAVASTSDSTTKDILNEYLDRSRYLNKLKESGNTTRKDYDSLELQISKLERELRTKSTEYNQFDRLLKADWKDIQKTLKPDEAAIEYVSFQWYDGKKLTDSTCYGAAVITQECTAPMLVVLKPEFMIEKAMKPVLDRATASNYIYSSSSTGKQKNKSEGLYSLIWKSVEPLIKDKKTVFVSPIGKLNQINFPALAITDGTEKPTGKMLMDQYKLITLGSTRSLLNRADWENNVYKNDANNKVLALGGIDYENVGYTTIDSTITASIKTEFRKPSRSRGGQFRNGFDYLAGSKLEADAIISLAHSENSTLLSGSNASEAKFKSIANSSNILHISTHGFFLNDSVDVSQKAGELSLSDPNKKLKVPKNPMSLTGLALAGSNKTWNKTSTNEEADSKNEDGILTALEVLNLDLSKTKLVVLSACETGLGQVSGAEGVLGLPRAFRLAGAKAVIMSLWKIPDLETVSFMTSFYKNYFDGKTVDQAFSETQLAMRSKYPDEPYKWAAFVLVR